MAGRFSVEAVFKAVDKVTAPVSRMQNRVGKFTRTASRGFARLNRVVGKFGQGLKKGAAIAGASLLAFGAIMVNLIGVGAAFGRAIGAAAAKFPDKIKRGTKAFKELEETARRVGATTEFTATQAAEGLNFLAKAGFTAAFSMKALPDIVDFATAAELDFAEAADIASDAIGAFGLDSDDLGKKMKGLRRVMDVMTLTANSTNVSVSELFESVKDGAPIATAAGVSIETFAATMGFLASNGIKAAKAGTAAKNITLALVGVGNKAAKTFKRLGISLQDSNGDARDQFDVLDELRSKLAEFGTVKRLAVMEAIFGKIPLAAASKLLTNAGKSVRGLRVELEKAGGSSKRTAAFIRDDVKGSIDGLNSAIDGVKISIFSLNEGPLKEAIDKMTDWVRVNEKLIAQPIGDFLLMIINNMGAIVTWTKRIAKGVAIFLIFATVLKTFILIMTAVNLVMALNPIGLIVLGVVALIAAFVALVVWIDDVAAGFDKLPFALKLVMGPINLLITAIKFIKDNFGSITAAASKVGQFFGFGDGDEQDKQGATGPQIVSPQDRVARSIEEQRTTSTSEGTIKDETGRAEVTGGKMGAGLNLQSSGAF